MSNTVVTHRRSFASLALATVATLALVSGAVAAPPSWTAPIVIRNANNLVLNDADFSGRNVAIAWEEPDSPSEVGIRTSTNRGSSFGPISWFGGSREAAVDICGGAELNAVMAHRIGPDNWFIEHAVGSIDGTGFLTTPVSPTDGNQNNPDVACAGGSVFVSWFENEGSGDRMFVAHARRTGGGFSMPFDLGFDEETFFGSSLAVAGADNMAYGVFTRSGGDLRLRRWSVGDGPGFAVTALPGQVIGPGTPNNSANYAVIAAAGSKVAVSWMTCSAVVARVSNDHGQTWGPIRTLIEHAACGGDFIAVQNSIAIRGDRIAVAYGAAGIVGDGEVGLIRTNNDFASFSDDMIAPKFHPGHLVGYLTVGGKVKLGAAFERPDVVRFRRQL